MNFSDSDSYREKVLNHLGTFVLAHGNQKVTKTLLNFINM